MINNLVSQYIEGVSKMLLLRSCLSRSRKLVDPLELGKWVVPRNPDRELEVCHEHLDK
jgi:hypothetical protein